mgnify:CR=1 FL=1
MEWFKKNKKIKLGILIDFDEEGGYLLQIFTE